MAVSRISAVCGSGVDARAFVVEHYTTTTDWPIIMDELGSWYEPGIVPSSSW